MTIEQRLLVIAVLILISACAGVYITVYHQKDK